MKNILIVLCGDTNGKPEIDKTPYLSRAYEMGKNIYSDQ